MSRCLVTLALFALSPAAAQLVKDWRVIRSPHFELVSRYDAKQTEKLLTDMEWLRAVFEKHGGAKYRRSRPALILVPDSPYDFEQMAPGGAAGYYVGVPSRHLIVLKEMFDARHSALHEFTHLTLNEESPRWPRWFNEGTSEFFGSARSSAGVVEAGAPIKRTDVLKAGIWVPPDVMFLRDPFEHVKAPVSMQRFYAQSWLYVHMLRLSPDYRDKFDQFRKRMADGQETNEALRQVYGKAGSDFDSDARRWYRQKKFPVQTFAAVPAAAPEFTARVMSQVEVDLVKATVAAYSGRNRDARKQYGSFSRQQIEGCEWQAALGDLAFAAHMYESAVGHYKEATGCGVTVSEILDSVEFAMHDRPRTPLRKEETDPLFRLGGAERLHYINGTAQFFAKEYEAAIESFAAAKNLSPDEVFRIARMKVIALTELGRFAEARTAAGELPALATDKEDHDAAALAVDDVDRAEKASASNEEPFHLKLLRTLSRVDGDVVNVDCMGAKARFTVRSGAQSLRLVIDDPGQVVTGATGAQLEFGCGPQKRPATIGYLAQPDPATGAVGRIRYIEFR